jgi:hypothetical protein
MATGNVTLVNRNGISGTVTVDETNEVLNFSDSNFPSTGLNDTTNTACTFDIVDDVNNPGQSIANNLKQLVAAAPQNITGPYTGNITANVGDVYTISTAKGVVNGNITINGGKVIVEQNAVINGSVNVSGDGIIVAKGGGQIRGNIGINTGGSLKVVNNGTIKGNIGINQAGRMIVGNANGPGFITGTVDIQKIRKFDVSAGSTITGQ